MILPEVAVKMANTNIQSGTRGFNKIPVAKIDAHVIGMFTLRMDSKKQQVTAPEFIFSHRVRVFKVIHFISGTRKPGLKMQVIGKKDQSTAVKAPFRGGSSPDIGFTELRLETLHDIFRSITQKVAIDALRAVCQMFRVRIL